MIFMLQLASSSYSVVCAALVVTSARDESVTILEEGDVSLPSLEGLSHAY